MTINRKKLTSFYGWVLFTLFLGAFISGVPVFFIQNNTLFMGIASSFIIILLIIIIINETIILGLFSSDFPFRFKVKNGELEDILDSRTDVKLGSYYGFAPLTPEDGIPAALSFTVQTKDRHVFHLHCKTLFYHLEEATFISAEPFIRRWHKKIIKDEPFYRQRPSDEKIVTLLQEKFFQHTKEELNSKFFLSELVNEALKELNEESFMKVRLYM